MLRNISYLFFLFTTVFAYGQVDLLVAREDKDLRVNEKFTVKFILAIEGEDNAQGFKLKLPDFSKFNLIGSGSTTNTYVDPETKILTTQMVYQVTLEPKFAGRVKLGSALANVSGRMYKTEPSDLIIGEAKSRSSSDDLASSDMYLNIEVKDRSVYANQPTVAVLKAYSKDFDNLRKVGKVTLPNQENVDFKTVSYKRSDIEHTSDNMASQIIGVYVIVPTESGKIELKPIHANVKHKDFKLSSNRINLNVKKLPSGSPSDFKNAVGTFDVEISRTASEAIEIEKPLDVFVKLKGEGNLMNINLPKLLPSENYKIFEPKISKNYANDGTKGEILAHYIVIPTKPGPVNISTESFAYFNPDEQKYVEIGSKTLNLDVFSHEQVSDSKSALEKVNDYTNTILETVNTPIINTSALQVKENKKLSWKTLFLNAGLFLGATVLLLLFGRSYRKRKLALQNVAPQKPIETIAEAEAKLKAKSNAFSLNDDLTYLKNLAENNSSKKFFESYDEMLKSINKKVSEKYGLNLETYIEQHLGAQKAEDFRNIGNKISVEKYSPITSERVLNNIYASIFQLFSDFEK